MINFPNCKINIGLNITEKRSDGYHNLQTVFLPVNLQDALEVIVSNTNEPITFTTSGISIPNEVSNNLCIKAYQLLQKDFDLPNIKLHLHKTIPVGAGLGGGSADAAFMLRLIDDKFKLNLSLQSLIEYALQLGSDCPFFIINQPCFATGRGEVLTPIAVNLKGYNLLLVNPQIHIATSWAFSKITPTLPNQSLFHLIQQPVETWQHTINNDFEVPVFNEYAEIKNIKVNMQNAGALYASMTGTGSTVFGIFKDDTTTKQLLNFPAHYFCKWLSL